MALVVTEAAGSVSLWEDPLSLLPRRRPQIFEREQNIYRPDDPADSLFLVVDGAVKVSRISDSGRETVLDVESSESFFGLSGILGEGRRGEAATAWERSSVMEWRVEDLRELMARSPELGPSLMRMVAKKLIEADQRIESFAVDHIPRRLIKTLLRLGERFGESTGSNGHLRLMPFTHELLARHVGTSREIVTQHMSQMRRKGVLDYSRAGLEFDPSVLRQELEHAR